MYVRPISTRLLRGMFTPEMRAMPLALSLLVTGIRADREHPPVAADDLALFAHRLDRRSYFHARFTLVVEQKLPVDLGAALETGAVAATSPRSTRSAKSSRCRRTRVMLAGGLGSPPGAPLLRLAAGSVAVARRLHRPRGG